MCRRFKDKSNSRSLIFFVPPAPLMEKHRKTIVAVRGRQGSVSPFAAYPDRINQIDSGS
jgi:hypothetical protein